MLVEELKHIIRNLSDDADIVMQKRVTGKWTMVAPVLRARITLIEDKKRLVLMNMKPSKKKTNSNTFKKEIENK